MQCVCCHIAPFFFFFTEGKAVKLISNAHFNKEASKRYGKRYGSLTELDRKELVGEGAAEVEMT